MAKAKEKQADFGFRRVPLGDKQALVDDVFHSVARRYDLMNDLMSGGLHRAWKEALVTAASIRPASRTKGRPGRLHEKGDTPFALLDLAGGTGDVAFRVADAGGPGTHVTVADINADMLAGRPRARRQGRARGRIHRGQRRGAAVPRPQLRRRHHRVRHPQRAADRRGAWRNPPRAEDRRAFSLPGILLGRCAGPRPALRPLFVQRHSGGRPRGDRRRRGLSLSGRIRSASFRARKNSPT